MGASVSVKGPRFVSAPGADSAKPVAFRDDVRGSTCKGFGHHGSCNRVFQTGGVDGQGVESAVTQGGDQGVDGCQIGRLHQGAIEHQSGHR